MSSSSSSSSVLPPPSAARLVTIVAQVDHGKTTLADSLIESNGIISERSAGDVRYLDSDEEEQRRGITMRASAIGLRHEVVVGGGRKESSSSSSSEASSLRVVHLVDCPGHVDFSAEVTSSLSACDGALVVVDAVEGVRARTHAILREVCAHGAVPVLVVNKIDRLCSDLRLTPAEAYARLRELVETVNAAAASVVSGRRHLENANEDNDEDNDEDENNNDAEENGDAEEEESWNFDPAKGNVVFASAYYNWGFTVPALARSLWRGRVLPFKPPVLRKLLFSECRYNETTKKMVKWRQGDDSCDPVFAAYALRPIWDVFEGVDAAARSVGVATGLFSDEVAPSLSSSSSSSSRSVNNKLTACTPGMDAVAAALSVGRTSRAETPEPLADVLARFSSAESVLRAVLRRYRPLSDAVLDAACDVVPSPKDAAARRHALRLRAPSSPPSDAFERIQNAVATCDPDGPTAAHACRFFVTDRRSIGGGTSDDEDGDGDVVLGLVRVLSGTLRSGASYHCFGPRRRRRRRETDDDDDDDDAPVRAVRLYLLMGSSFVAVPSVPAGHVCAASGLEDLRLRAVTLCDSPRGGPAARPRADDGARPLIRVHVAADDAPRLERALVRLAQADASVEVSTTSRGERSLACLGEMHLERCVHDLERSRCDEDVDAEREPLRLTVSDPVREFGESTAWFEGEREESYAAFAAASERAPPARQTEVPPYRHEEGLERAHRGRCRALLSGRGAAISLRALPLSERAHACLERGTVDTEEDAEELTVLGRASGVGEGDARTVLEALRRSLLASDKHGNALLEAPGVSNGDRVKGVVVEEGGEVYVPPLPRRRLGQTGSHEPPSSQQQQQQQQPHDDDDDDQEKAPRSSRRRRYEELWALVRGEEPTIADSNNDDAAADGVAARVWRSRGRGSAVAGFQLAARAGPLCEEAVHGVLVVLEGVEIALAPSPIREARPLAGGLVVAALRSGVRCALLTRPVRLTEAVLRLTLHTSLAGLGPLHAVLSKRRGRVVSDDVVEGTDLLAVVAHVPQAESFRLGSELLEKSSGEAAAPELVFSHRAVLDEDPFWIPTSLEEREDYGEIVFNGDASTGMDNTALRYIRETRKRKGLLVDSSKIVVAAEKQRTLARKK